MVSRDGRRDRRAAPPRADRPEHRRGRAARPPRRGAGRVLLRLRPDGAEPARRAPAAVHGAAGAAAGRPPARRPGRRRHRADRRPAPDRGAAAQRPGRPWPSGCSASASRSRPSSTCRRRPTGLKGPIYVDNLEWTAPLSAIDFLRDIGKHFRVSQMLAKEAVSARLNSEAGISYTEFSYQILQANDFLELFRRARGDAADRRLRPVGQPHRRHRPGPPGRGRVGARAVDAAGDQVRRHQVRQVRGRRGLARPVTDVAVRVLPVLAQRRRRRRPHLAAAVLRAAGRRDRGADRRERRAPGGPDRAAGAGRGADRCSCTGPSSCARRRPPGGRSSAATTSARWARRRSAPRCEEAGSVTVDGEVPIGRPAAAADRPGGAASRRPAAR